MQREHMQCMAVTFRYPRVCLTNRVCEHGTDTNVPDQTDQLPGERYTATEQCQLMYDLESFNCVSVLLYITMYSKGIIAP